TSRRAHSPAPAPVSWRPRAQRLFDRRELVREVVLVEVDVVGLEAPQAPFDRFHDVAARCVEAAASRRNRGSELGGEHDVLSPIAEDLAERFLGAALDAVRIGRVEYVTPASSAACTTLRAPSRSSDSIMPPKLLQPSPTTDTSRPVRPNTRYSMWISLGLRHRRTN